MRKGLKYVLRGGLVLLGLAVVGASYGLYRVYSPVHSPRPLVSPAVAEDTPEGKTRLLRAASVDAPLLERAFVTQQHGSFCGIASSVIALDALGVAHVTQSDFFDERSSKIQTYAEAFFGGITLDELGGLLEAHGAKTRVVHVEPNGLAAFRDAARANFAREGDVLLVNYDRRKVSEEGGGHISPLSAYDEATDSVLLVDVAAYKYPPHWVPVAALFEAMATTDPFSDKTRGYVEVSR